MDGRTPLPTVLGALTFALVLSACEGKLESSNAYPGPGGTPAGSDGGTAGTDVGTQPSKPLASLEISASVTTLLEGQTTVFSVVGRAADDSVVEGVDVDWMSTALDVVSVAADGTISALVAGQASVSARSGDIQSNAIELTVLPPAQGGEDSVRIEPSRVTVPPGGALQLSALARDALGNPVAEPEVTWVVGNAQLIQVDAEGVLSGLAEGETWVTARYEDAESARVGVLVQSSGTYLAVDFQMPSSDVAAVDTLQVAARVQELRADSSSILGVPVAADSVEVLIDDQVMGTLTSTYGVALGEVAVGGLSVGAHEIRLRAQRGGASATSAALILDKLSPHDGSWVELGSDNAASGEEIDLRVTDTQTQIAANQCRRFCALEVHDFDVSNETWDEMSYMRSEWRDWDNTVEEREREVSTVSLPRFVGWGWTGANSRAPDFLEDGDRPMVAWANDDARRGFNDAEMPERYWFDCYVAEWDSSGGIDGAGGWRLLSPDRPEFLWDLPSPDEINAEFGERENWRFPAGADSDRTRDCDYPQVVVDPADSAHTLLAFVSSPVANPSWQLELRRWTGEAWEDVAPPHAIEGSAPQLTELRLDAVGRPVATLVTADGHGQVLRLQGTGWVVLGAGEYAPSIAMARPTANGSVLGIGRVDEAGTDARVYLGGDLSWAPLGDRLERQPWAEVHDLRVHSAGTELFAAWTEGPELGNRNLYVARWAADRASWEVVGDGPAELNPDRGAYDPRLAVRPNGRLVLAYSEPTDDPDAPLVQRVLETTMPVVSGQ